MSKDRALQKQALPVGRLKASEGADVDERIERPLVVPCHPRCQELGSGAERRIPGLEKLTGRLDGLGNAILFDEYFNAGCSCVRAVAGGVSLPF